MGRTTYINLLPDKEFCKVYQALKKADITEEGITLALNSRLCDLEDVIDIREILEEESA